MSMIKTELELWYNLIPNRVTVKFICALIDVKEQEHEGE